MLVGMADPVRSQHHARFPVDAERLWQHVVAVDRYRAWWPWLRRLDARDVAAGEVWHCTIQGRVPYRLRLRLTLVDVAEPTWVRAEVDGDLRGRAELRITSDGDGGSSLDLRSTLTPTGPMVRLGAALAPGIARRGHDRIITNGMQRMRAALDDG